MQIHHLVEKGSLDVVFVDGRARVQCALMAIPYINPDGGVVVMHDFERPRYQKVLKYYEKLMLVNRIVVMRPTAEARANPPTGAEIEEFAG